MQPRRPSGSSDMIAQHPALPPLGRPRGALTRALAPAATIGAHHFQLLRGLVDGLPPGELWQRYMAFTGLAWDPRLLPGRLQRIVQAVRAAAITPEAQTLCMVALHPTRLGVGRAREASESAASPPCPTRPSLTDWINEQIEAAAARGDELEADFYSQREWLELYEAEHGLNVQESSAPVCATAIRDARAPLHSQPTPRPTAAAQVAALRELERNVALRLAPDQAIAAWFTPRVAAALKGVGVLTLGEMLSYVSVHGYRWYRRVPGLGPALAARIIAWLVPTAQDLGRPLPEHATTPRAQLAIRQQVALERTVQDGQYGIVPLQRLAVPPELAGRRGGFRLNTPNTFGVDDDLAAIQAWLARYQHSPRTFVSYGLAVERFYLWCVVERGRALSALSEADLHTYRTFLTQPPAHWVAPNGMPRTSAHWRPLRGPLDPRSVRHNFAVLGSLFRGLVDAGYISVNAVRGITPMLKLPRPTLDTRRSFSASQWAHVMATLAERPDSAHARRLKLVLELGASTGLRLAEMTCARRRDLRREHIDGDSVWLLHVIGKGLRERDVVVFDDIKALIDQHHADMLQLGIGHDPRVRTLRSLAPGATPPETPDDGWAPLVGALRAGPPRWRGGSNGVATLDRGGPTQADAYGALDSSALYQSLKRLFRAAARSAEDNPRLNEQDRQALQRASTHWLRHFFGNNAVDDGVELTALREMFGHADLKTTTIYTRAETRRVVAEARKLRRR
jgi:site-specific recombinase XerD